MSTVLRPWLFDSFVWSSLSVSSLYNQWFSFYTHHCRPEGMDFIFCVLWFNYLAKERLMSLNILRGVAFLLIEKSPKDQD